MSVFPKNIFINAMLDIEKEWQADSIFSPLSLTTPKQQRIHALKNMINQLEGVEKIVHFSIAFFALATFFTISAISSIAINPILAFVLIGGGAFTYALSYDCYHVFKTAKKMKSIISEFTHTLERGPYEYKGNTTFEQRCRWSSELRDIVFNSKNLVGGVPF